MTRFLLACIFYSTVAQWGYNEVALVFPSAVPYINQAMRKVQIPTHNYWSKEAVERYVDNAATITGTIAPRKTPITRFEFVILKSA